jgi:2-C-methyl-D-erythritol 4-phosphate cytidylyltransferase
MRVAAIVVAAGLGERLGLGRPKALVPLCGRPLLAHAVEALAASGVPGTIVVVHPEGYEAECRRAAEQAAGAFPLRFTEGGLSRQESVAHGLALVDEAWDVVFVHDAARPLVTPACVRALAGAFPSARAASLAVPANDTTVEAEHGRIGKSLDRDRLWLLQTPQAFERALLTAAHARAGRDVIAATDDTSLVLSLGIEVHLVPGEPENRKITTDADLLFAEAVLSRRATRPAAL